MPFGKIGVLILAVAVAVGLGGFGAALKQLDFRRPRLGGHARGRRRP